MIVETTHIAVVQFHTISFLRYAAIINCHDEAVEQAVVTLPLIIPILICVAVEL